MVNWINNLDGSKLAILGAFLLALAALILVGWHLIAVDGVDAIPEIGFMEKVVETVLYMGTGISTVHVVTGAVVNAKAAKNANQPGNQPQTNGAGQPG